ncbi:MAG: hypothetical protein Q7U74_11620 [Saprospiraceae bacterium]|nr:hypothetical protein [Saprospiraceae bacterium]
MMVGDWWSGDWWSGDWWSGDWWSGDWYIGDWVKGVFKFGGKDKNLMELKRWNT